MYFRSYLFNNVSLLKEPNDLMAHRYQFLEYNNYVISWSARNAKLWKTSPDLKVSVCSLPLYQAISYATIVFKMVSICLEPMKWIEWWESGRLKWMNILAYQLFSLHLLTSQRYNYKWLLDLQVTTNHTIKNNMHMHLLSYIKVFL